MHGSFVLLLNRFSCFANRDRLRLGATWKPSDSEVREDEVKEGGGEEVEKSESDRERLEKVTGEELRVDEFESFGPRSMRENSSHDQNS